MTAARAGPAPITLRGERETDLAAVRELLTRHDYSERALCERSGYPSIYAFRSIAEGRAPSEVRDGLDMLIRLFMDGVLVDRADAARLLGDDGLQALAAVGLIGGPADRPDQCFANVLLYPTRGLWIVSDLTGGTAGSPEGLREDAVYPAITAQTRDYFAGLSAAPCERFLEMCGGTGIAALDAAPRARHAWSADVTERCTRFGEFNARLNGITNFSAVQGDLWEPLQGMTFDRIVAHPPYVAALRREMIYRDGGVDGEQITRGVIAGLAEHLEPGGRFFCTCVATDRKDAPLEQRVRAMLGPMEAEFDVLLVARGVQPASEYYRNAVAQEKLSADEASRYIATFEALGVEQLVYCTIGIERHGTRRAPITERRLEGRAPIGAAIAWLFDWNLLQRAPDFRERLLGGRLRVPVGVTVRTERRNGRAGWGVTKGQVDTETPFLASVDCSANTAALVIRCDGTVTPGDLAREVSVEAGMGLREAEQGLVEFATAFVGAGCLISEMLPSPGAPE